MRTWLALIVAPSLALVCLSVNYALVALMRACASANVALNGVSIASFVVCVAATLLAWRRWRTTRDALAADSVALPARAGFMASVATGVGVISVLSILAISIPQWLLPPC
jgi:hypothetical protein